MANPSTESHVDAVKRLLGGHLSRKQYQELHKSNPQWEREDLKDYPVLLQASDRIFKYDPWQFIPTISDTSPMDTKPTSFAEWLSMINKSVKASQAAGEEVILTSQEAGELVAWRDDLEIKRDKMRAANQRVELVEEWITTLNLVLK